MIKKFCLTLVTGFVLIAYIRCKQPYILPASSANNNTLVVEGVINTGAGPTTIKLGRTVKLTDSVTENAELGAQVTIESDASPTGTAVAALADSGAGRYIGYATGLSPANNYRLRIVTSAGKTYLSAFVPVKNAPPIDSVSFEVRPDGVYVFSNTHDPANNTRYYRWDYSETWIIHSAFQSNYDKQFTPKDSIILRQQPANEIYICWATDASSTIILNSSAKLSQDIIAHNQVAFIGSTSEKLGVEYSISLNQYALTSDAFNYWQNLKLNTEQLGSIFDAQPSQLQGNIHCLSAPSEPVRGYVSAGAASQKTIFIGNSSVPYAWHGTIISPYGGCRVDSLYFSDPATGANTVLGLFQDNQIPVFPIGHPVTLGYTAGSPFCVDCRLRGTNKQPSFWVYKY